MFVGCFSTSRVAAGERGYAFLERHPTVAAGQYRAGIAGHVTREH